MGTPQKFALPSPNFNKKMSAPLAAKPHFLTPSGMTLHARHQPPPMYGKRGATYPGKFLKSTHINNKFLLPVTTETVPAEPQFCEACEMELQSMEDLRRHKAQHEKCPVDTCNYHGHPSVMDKHVDTLHSSGLFDKFKKLSSPEEIAAWRAERKRKYPTLENCLMRQRAKEQRQKRGERLEGSKDRFGKYGDRKRAQNNNESSSKNQGGQPNRRHDLNQRNEPTKRNSNKRRRKEQKQKVEEKKQNEEIEKLKTAKKVNKPNNEEDNKDEDETSCNGIYMFRGTNRLSNYQHLGTKKSKEINVLSSLVGMYGSDEDSEEDSNDDNEDISLCSINSELSLNITEHSVDSTNKPNSTLVPDKNNTNEVVVENDSFVEPENFQEPLNSPTLEVSTKNKNADVNESPTKHVLDVADDSKYIETNISKSLEQTDECNFNKSNEASPNCSGDEAPEEAPIARSTDIPMPSKQTHPIENTNNNVSNQLPPGKHTKSNQFARLHKQKSGLDYRKARLRNQNTLLEKLLEPDIRHERNVLLQCVRYVCENKFFGIGQTKD